MIKSFFKLLGKYWLFLTTVSLIVIAITSLVPLPELPEVPGKDKTLHLIAYSALAFPCALAKPKTLWLYFPLLFILFSGMIELIQPYVNRYAEWLDLLANATGVILGNIIGLITRKLVF